MNTAATTFADAVKGSRGTVVFGAGVPAVTGDIIHAQGDHLVVETSDRDGYETIVVPVASIAYYRFAREDA